MKVKIIKSSRRTYWYNYDIGKIYEVIDSNDEDFRIASGAFTGHYLYKEDCEIIKENNMKSCDTCTHHNLRGTGSTRCCICLPHYKYWEKKENDMDLKMGDEVEIYNRSDQEWQKRIFIKYGSGKSIIYVVLQNTEDFKNNHAFDTTVALMDKWRLPKEPKYRPFTFEDRELFRDKWIKNKITKDEHFIVGITTTGLSVFDLSFGSSFVFIHYPNLLSNWEFIDGSPCGVEIKD